MISMCVFVWWSYIFPMHHKHIKTICYVTDLIEFTCWINQLLQWRQNVTITWLNFCYVNCRFKLKKTQLKRSQRLNMYLILWLIKTLHYVSKWKMVRRICEITVTLDFIFRLVLCSHEDVSFNSICLNVLEDIIQFYLSMWFKKNRLETLFKSDSEKH